ncbi:MAG: VWA domain-containing protein [Acidimicrobiia bacterium]|nr:VWA domain-containing protein [Acidimicrobiia bacterium]
MRSRLALCLCASVACLATAASAQQPAQPTFRGGVNYVRVDMFATLDGEPVEDLRQDELELLEDGTRQQLDTFEHVKIRPAGAQDTRVEPNSIAESRQMAAEARARVFVIFLDTHHTQIEGSANMRLPLVRFLDRLLGQDDMVALMTPEMSANDLTFGRKTTVISNIMQNEWTWGRRAQLSTDNDPVESLYETCFPSLGDSERIAAEMKERRRERLTLDALEDLMITLRGIREERKAVITVSEGWRLFTENQGLARSTTRRGILPAPPRVGVDPGGRITRDPEQGRTRSTGVDMQQCESDRLAFSLMNSELRVRELVDSANRANVSFYTVYPRGLAPFDSPIGPEKPPSPAQDRANLNARIDNLRELATNTDGLAIVNTNDIEGGLRRVVADLSSYYLLGYYSSNTRLDGRFRTITVRVKRPGVQVRARRGYRGLTADELLTTRDGGGGGAAAASPVSVAVNPRATFRIRTSVWTPDPANASVWVAGELDYATRRDLAWTTGADADIVVVAANGTEVVSTTAEVAAGEGAFSLRVPTDSLTSGEYAVRVRLRPKGSGLPVTDTTRLIVPTAAGALGEPVMLRRGPSTGPRHLVTADPRFTRSDRIRFEVPTSAQGTATGRMLDRLGKPMQVPVQVSERADASGAFRWIVADAALAPLAPGDYGVEVSLGNAKQVGSFKVVP